jgi:hypothetical protein
MMLRLKRYLFLSPVLFVLVASLNPIRVAAFNPFNPNSNDNTVCDQTDATGNKSSVCNIDPNNDPITGSDGLVNKVANIISLLTGVAAVIVIMIAGLRYIMSSGDGAKTASAKNAILYASIGLVVTIVARAVVALVVTRL